MVQVKRGCSVWAVLVLLGGPLGSALSAQNCGNGWLDVSVQGSALANRFAIWTHGRPAGFAWLGMDTQRGSLLTPAGEFCLALSPSFQMFPMPLDGEGVGRLEGFLPYDPGLVGLSYHLQAASLDPRAPAGLALSPLRTVELHRPRVFVMDVTEVGNDQLLAYDALDASSLWTRSFTSLDFMESLRGAGIVCVGAEGAVFGLDAATGATLWTAAGVAGPLAACRGDDPREVLVLTGSELLRIRSWDGVVLSRTPHQLAAALSAPGPVEMRSLAGSTRVLVRSANQIDSIDHGAGTSAAIAFAPPGGLEVLEWAVGGGVLAVIAPAGTPPTNSGLMLHLTSLATGQALPGSPRFLSLVAVNFGRNPIEYGVTPGGQGFLLSSSRGFLAEYDTTGQLLTFVTGAGVALDLLPVEGGLSWIRPVRSGQYNIAVELIDGLSLTRSVVGTVPGESVTQVTERRGAEYPAAYLTTGRQVFGLRLDAPYPSGLFVTPPTNLATRSELTVTDG